MAISDELMLAVLSMDSYNRGYDEGIEGLGGLGSFVGNAQIMDQSDVLPDSTGVDAGFYAVAYEWNGDTVISCRSTGYCGAQA